MVFTAPDVPFMPSIKNIQDVLLLSPLGGATKDFFPSASSLLKRVKYQVSIGAVVYGEPTGPFHSILDWVFANVYPGDAHMIRGFYYNHKPNPIELLAQATPAHKMVLLDMYLTKVLNSAAERYEKDEVISWAHLPVTHEESPVL